MTATLYQSAWARLRCCNKTPKSQGLKTTKVYFSFTPQVLLTKQSHQGQGKEAWQAAPAAQCPAWEGHTSTASTGPRPHPTSSHPGSPTLPQACGDEVWAKSSSTTSDDTNTTTNSRGH